MINWEELEAIENGWQQIRSERFPSLSRTYVPGEGDNPEAFIVGEAPGAQEDVQRRPFVGAAGVVLRQLMDLAELRAGHTIAPDVENCWLTNVVKFRPPRNRNPIDVEVKAARPLLRREWRAVGKPRLIIPVGGIALQAITGKRISILRAAGKCHYYAGRNTGKGAPTLAVWPMVHPSYVLRNRTRRLEELIEEDWERLGVWRNANT